MTEGTIPAPCAIDGTPDGIERMIYGQGDLVSVEEAKRLYDQGRWPGPDPLPTKRTTRKAAKRAKKGPTEDRAKRLREDRSK